MGMGDDVGTDDVDDTLANGRTLSDEESVDSSVNDDAISCITTTNSIKTGAPKKRVQFPPDDFLVRVREIPPRSNKSSSESDGSASDSSDSDGSDTDSATDSEDVSSERDTPSPAAPVESQNKFNTMPPLMYAAKGSYSISKQNAVKSSNNVAKITGINPPAIPQSSYRKQQTKKPRRTPSPKLEKRTKKTPKPNEKVNNKKTPPQNENLKPNKKRTPLKIKEGRISPPPPTKQNNSKNTTGPKPSNNSSVKLFQRRGSGAVTSKSSTARKPVQTIVTTSVTALPNTVTAPSPDSSVDRVSRAVQSLTMGKLYTLDGFIFPPHHAKELHLPDLSSTSKSEDFDKTVFTASSKRSSVDLSSPRRSYPESGHNFNNNNSMYPSTPQSANRKRRYYAWQMANGSIQNTLHSTPNIYQLWDNPVSVRSSSDTMEKSFSNSR